jgi:hypothetical protein
MFKALRFFQAALIRHLGPSSSPPHLAEVIGARHPAGSGTITLAVAAPRGRKFTLY